MILFRATFLELIGPFFLTGGVMSFILLLQQFYRIVLLMVEKGFGIFQAMLMLAYLIPQILTITIPLGVVGAVFMTVIRLSVDSEIVCMRAAGRSLWNFSLPILFFGLIASLVTSVIMNWIHPLSYRNYSELQVRIVKQHADEKLLPGEFNFDFGNKAIKIGGRSPEKELSDIFIADRDLSPSSPIILADKGRIEVDEESKRVFFRLRRGVVYLPENDPQKFQTVDFKTLNYLLEFQPENSVSENLLKRTGTLQLIRKLETFAPGSLSKFRWLAELYGRLILPWVCLVFSLAAIPMAIVDPRSGRSGSYLRAFFLVVTFYLIWVGFKDLVSAGKAPPATLVLPLVLIFLYGLLRLWQIDWEVRPLAALANFRTSRR